MSDIKIQKPTTPLQQSAMDDRLKQLGIEVDGSGAVDPKSVAQLRSGKLEGAEALAAVAQDGQLTHDGTAQLEKGVVFAKVFRGRAASIDDKQTNAVRTLMLTLDGVGGAIRAALRDGGAPSIAALGNINRRAANLEESWKKALPKDKGMGRVDPQVVAALAKKLQTVGQLAVDLAAGASRTRTAVAELRIQGLAPISRAQKLFAQMSCSSSVRTLDSLRSVSEAATGQPLEERSRVTTGLEISPEFGAVGPHAARYSKMASEVVGGLFSSTGVVEAGGMIQTLMLETNLPPDAIAKGLKVIIGADFVKARNGAGAELLAVVRQYTAAVEHKGEDEISNAELVQTMKSHRFFTGVLSEIARAHPDDEKAFLEAATLAAKDEDALAGWVAITENPKLAEASDATKAAPAALMAAIDGIDNVLTSAQYGDPIGLAQALPQAREAVAKALADVSAAIDQLGSTAIPQRYDTRLQLAHGTFVKGFDMAYAGPLEKILSPDGVRAEGLDAGNIIGALALEGEAPERLAVIKDPAVGQALDALVTDTGKLLALRGQLERLVPVKPAD